MAKTKKYKKPTYKVDGKKYTLRDYGNLKLSETKELDKLLQVSQMENNEMQINTSNPFDIYSVVLQSIDEPGEPVKIDYDNMTINEMMDFTARVVIDFVLERDHFLAGMPGQMKSLGRLKAKQRLNI